MNASRAWIVEVFVPEGIDDPRSQRTRSRYAEWKAWRKASKAPHKYRSSFGQGDEPTCIYCDKEEEPWNGGGPRPEDRCPKAPIRTAHWRICRVNGDSWEGVRRKDRMILEEAMEAIRRQTEKSSRSHTFRLRNIKTNDVIMGAVVCADVPRPQAANLNPAAGVASTGFSHSKN